MKDWKCLSKACFSSSFLRFFYGRRVLSCPGPTVFKIGESQSSVFFIGHSPTYCLLLSKELKACSKHFYSSHHTSVARSGQLRSWNLFSLFYNQRWRKKRLISENTNTNWGNYLSDIFLYTIWFPSILPILNPLLSKGSIELGSKCVYVQKKSGDEFWTDFHHLWKTHAAFKNETNFLSYTTKTDKQLIYRK